MDLIFSITSPSFYVILILIFLLSSTRGISGTTFTFINRCDYTVWPGIQPNAGTAGLDTTGFELRSGGSRSSQAPPPWSGRFWGRTGCNFDAGSGQGRCATGDCGSGQVECNGAGGSLPATLAEFTIGSGTQDFYDVSLVDGYNLPMLVEASGGSGACASTGCATDLNRQCPEELRVGYGEACKSACEAFGKPEFCCSGAYGSPATCRPSVYAQMFKSACPRSYSYAYDDPTSTFTCTGADYTITFCPSVTSRKSSRDSSPVTATAGGTAVGSGSGSGSGQTPLMAAGNSSSSSSLPNFATGDSSTLLPFSAFTIASAISCLILL
ncbi:thaumatin-like protein 1 [Malania oleifera]|uniref:thaumatin-like protein 1 n=1 Tax=Malania oleifera TaxID=397392 RepID=UPI0025AE45D8|nr:thaumatin-like protein 1 [Malania oleifera]